MGLGSGSAGTQGWMGLTGCCRSWPTTGAVNPSLRRLVRLCPLFCTRTAAIECFSLRYILPLLSSLFVYMCLEKYVHVTGVGPASARGFHAKSMHCGCPAECVFLRQCHLHRQYEFHAPWGVFVFTQEEECVENLFDALAAALLVPDNQQRFRQGGGGSASHGRDDLRDTRSRGVAVFDGLIACWTLLLSPEGPAGYVGNGQGWVRELSMLYNLLN